MIKVDATNWTRMQLIDFYTKAWGCPVIPMKEVSIKGELGKRPMIRWIKYQTEKPTPDDYRSWFLPPYTGIPDWAIRDGSPREPWGLAIVHQQNLFSIDLDNAEVYEYLKEQGAYPQGACIWKTRKGFHVLMRSDIAPYTIKEGQLKDINPLFAELGIGGENNSLSIVPDTPDREWIELYDTPVTVKYESWLQQYLGWSKHPLRRISDYVKPAEDWVKEALGGVGEGERDNTCIKLASHYRALGWPIEATMSYLKAEYAPKCRPPFEDVDKCVRSAYRYEDTKPTGEQGEYGPPQTLQEFLGGIKSRPQLIVGLASPGELVMVFGTTGVGKSTFLEYIVACACASVNIADIFLVMRPLKCLFIDAQMAPAEVGVRFETLFAKLGGSENFTIKSVSDFDITKPEAQRWLYDTVKGGKYDLVAIDPFEDIHHLDENKNDEMARVVAPMRKVANDLNCVVFIGHHAGGDQYESRTGKMMPKKPRGATAITDRMDTIIELLNTEEDLEKIFHVRKMRRALMDRQKDIILKYDPETLLMELGGIASVVKAYKQGARDRYQVISTIQQIKALGLTDEAIAQKVGVTRATITRYDSGSRRPDAEMVGKLSALLKELQGGGRLDVGKLQKRKKPTPPDGYRFNDV